MATALSLSTTAVQCRSSSVFGTQASLKWAGPVSWLRLNIEAKAHTRKEERQARHGRIRKKVEGTPERPRLSVYRSNKHICGMILAKSSVFPYPAPSPVNRSCRYNSTVVKATLIRTPLETPGAYQLLNEETGEKLIVWGGIEPSDGFVPPSHLLQSSNWNSSARKSSGPNASNHSIDSPSTSTMVASFGRLKAQKVRALVKRTSKMRQGLADIHDRGVGRVSLSKTNGTFEVVESPDSSSLSGTERSSELKIAPVQPLDSDSETNERVTPVRKASSARLRGWGGGPSIHINEPPEITKGHARTRADSGFFSRRSFADLGCSGYMIDSLRKQSFLSPSNIQAMAFTPVVEGNTCIIADQSGSGKTLAYLIPAIQCLREEELQGVSKTSPGSPRMVVLVPTAELASQVLVTCRSMSRSGIPFRSMAVTGGFRQKTQLENLEEGVDVLIATPGRFMFLMKEGFLQLLNLKFAVLDEVDILIKDEDFEEALQCLINSSPITAQYLFVTATLPVEIFHKLIEVFPDCKVVMGPRMHRISSGLEEVLVDCSGEGTEKTPEKAFLNKKAALLQIVEGSPASKTIIFCNKVETCRKVENILKRFDRKESHVRVLPFHSALAQETRLSNMKEFNESKAESISEFLVCTDRASRGIDFSGVDHIILFDFPRDPSEYVRRVGRTARGAGGKGKAFVFVVGKQISLARRIMERNKKGHPLHDVPPAY